MWESKKIIGISGAPATGKSTLVDLIWKLRKREVERCDEYARESAQLLGYSRIADIYNHKKEEFQNTILHYHLNRGNEFLRTSEKNFLICDTTIFDIYAHSILAHHRIGSEFMDYLRNLCLMTAQSGRYAKIFFLPIIPLLDAEMQDGFRTSTTRCYIDALLRGIFNQMGVEYHVLPDDLEQRLDIVSRYIDDSNDRN